MATSNEQEPGGAVYTPIPRFEEWYVGAFHPGVVDRSGARLVALKSAFSPERFAEAIDVVRRYAAVDTGAIEGLYEVDRGFTKTIATHAAHWELALQQKGDRVRNAIMDAVDAYEYVLDVTTGAVSVTEKWIRELHEIICRSQESYGVFTAAGPQNQPLPKGVYKRHPNSPTNASTGRTHEYAPPEETPHEMWRFVEELRGDAFAAAHPVLQAAYAHYAYVCIHPFADGNGRVARALASAYLYRSPGVPLVVFADQRDLYLDALESADAGDPAQFIDFINDRAVDAVGLLEASLRSAADDGDDVARSLRRLYADYDDDAVRVDLATRVAAICGRELRKALNQLELPAEIEAGVAPMGGELPVPSGYSSFGPAGHLVLFARSASPFSFTLNSPYQVFLSRPGSPDADFVVGSQTSEIALSVRRRNLEPFETENLRLLAGLWAEAEVRSFAAEVLHTVERARERARAASAE